MNFKKDNQSVFKCPHCGMILKTRTTSKENTGVCLSCQSKILISSITTG
ncbi:MAG: hypothetical protein JXR70_09000 [Spirochaetales bacterium]|nr:hypothetical protein [Spirochaetales bacterium]